MNFTMIEHKLHIFISSKCGGRYSIARKALKTLLESTGLVETYVFESESASSQDTQSAYLNYVDESNLCVFLIDNKDGIPAAVLSEERRAKAKALRLIYIFCDAEEKTPTVMQEEIKNNLSQKYVVVHDFSDIVGEAYRSVMQDIIAIYKQKPALEAAENGESDPQTYAVNSKSALYSMPKSRFNQFANVLKELWKNPFENFSNKGNDSAPSKLNEGLAIYLKFVLRKTPFDKTKFSELCQEIIKEQDASLSTLLKYRFEAQRLYNSEEFAECLEQLSCAIKEALTNNSVPNWLANDIAVDIRHVHNIIAEINSSFLIDNPGQKIIDDSLETVYYPLLDRQSENLYEEVSNQYFNKLHQSPFTVQIGGLNSMFSSLVTSFCIAEMHGSIVQTEITIDRLIALYSMLCSTQNDHGFGIELIRLLVINRRNKPLDNIVRDCPFYENTLSASDIDQILISIENIPHIHHKRMSKYFLASRFGYIMSDNTFEVLCRDLIEFSFEWVKDEKRIFNYFSFIFDFYKNMVHRLNKDAIVEFILNVFFNNLKRFYFDCFKVLENLDFSDASDEDQKKVLKLLCDIVNGDIEITEFDRVESVVIRFGLSAKIDIEELNVSLQNRKPDFYKTIYSLEMTKNSQDCFRHIQRYVAIADERNKTQGLNGCYSGYAFEPYDVIYNILSFDDVAIDSAACEMLKASALETLAAENQTASAKISAIQLLIYLRTHYPDEEFWTNLVTVLEENADVFSNGVEMGFLDKTTGLSLHLSFTLLLSCFCDTYDTEISEYIFSINQEDAYDIIKALQFICKYLDCHSGTTIRNTLLSAMVHFSMIMSTHKERDVKYFAAKCLIALTHFQHEQKLILMQLSKLMDSSTQNVKIAILTRVSKIKTDDSNYAAFILKKGIVDSNYLVRSIAERELRKTGGYSA